MYESVNTLLNFLVFMKSTQLKYINLYTQHIIL